MSSAAAPRFRAWPLRLYDERSLLVPALVDADSGYRDYKRLQIGQMQRIRLLRLMDVPVDMLDQIRPRLEAEAVAGILEYMSDGRGE